MFLGSAGTAIINLRKTWEKLLLAARVIAAIENPSDICILSNRLYGQVSKQFVCNHCNASDQRACHFLVM